MKLLNTDNLASQVSMESRFVWIEGEGRGKEGRERGGRKGGRGKEGRLGKGRRRGKEGREGE